MIDLMENTWSFRVGQKVVSMDYQILVYKVDYLIQSSLLSSHVLTQYKVLLIDQS